MTLAYIVKVGLQVYSTNIRAKKIDKSIFITQNIILSSF